MSGQAAHTRRRAQQELDFFQSLAQGELPLEGEFALEVYDKLHTAIDESCLRPESQSSAIAARSALRAIRRILQVWQKCSALEAELGDAVSEDLSEHTFAVSPSIDLNNEVEAAIAMVLRRSIGSATESNANQILTSVTQASRKVYVEIWSYVQSNQIGYHEDDDTRSEHSPEPHTFSVVLYNSTAPVDSSNNRSSPVRHSAARAEAEEKTSSDHNDTEQSENFTSKDEKISTPAGKESKRGNRDAGRGIPWSQEEEDFAILMKLMQPDLTHVELTRQINDEFQGTIFFSAEKQQWYTRKARTWNSVRLRFTKSFTQGVMASLNASYPAVDAIHPPDQRVVIDWAAFFEEMKSAGKFGRVIQQDQTSAPLPEPISREDAQKGGQDGDKDDDDHDGDDGDDDNNHDDHDDEDDENDEDGLGDLEQLGRLVDRGEL